MFLLPLFLVKAVNFCKKAIQFTTDQGLPINRGLCFEEYLYELGGDIK